MSIFNFKALNNFFGLSGEDEYGYILSKKQTEQIYSSFGSLLKALRKSEHLTSSELAQRSGISQSYISQLENNVRLPSDKIIDKLVYALMGYQLSDLTDAAIEIEYYPLDSDEDKKLYRELVQNLKEVRDYMKIKDIPSLLSQDDLSSSLSLDERELLRNFSLLTNEGKDRLLSYLNFLLNDSK